VRYGVLAIDPTARVAPNAVIGSDVMIGPYCVVGPDVAIGEGCKLVAHVHLAGHTTIGANTTIYPFASLGTPPQSVHYRGGPTRLTIGAKCQIRENVTVNIGTEDGGGITTVGDNCFLMTGSHVGHDCQVGNNVIFANNAVLGGHCEIGQHTFLGGHCAVHQFTRIGESVMVSGYTALSDDVIPYGFVLHAIGRLVGVNLIGMRRRGVSKEAIRTVRKAYAVLFEDEGPFAPRIDKAEAEFGNVPEVAKIIAFLRGEHRRPIMLNKPRGRRADTDD
jgi:UDP-N-acetylglucosamine acyltransferase